MIETGSRAPVRRPNESHRLTPRAARVRNGCLILLARTRALPVPSDHDLAALADDISLGVAWEWWSGRHAVAPRVVTRAAPAPPAWWRSRRLAWAVVVISALASAWVVRAQVMSRAAVAEESGSIEPMWSMVSVNDLANANSVLIRLGQTSAPVSVPLSAAEVASLAFRSALRQQPPSVANLEARIDSLIAIRGTVIRERTTTQFELRGRVRVAAPRVAQIDVVEMRVTDLATGRRLPATQSGSGFPPIRFRVPSSVKTITLVDGKALLGAGDR